MLYIREEKKQQITFLNSYKKTSIFFKKELTKKNKYINLIIKKNKNIIVVARAS